MANAGKVSEKNRNLGRNRWLDLLFVIDLTKVRGSSEPPNAEELLYHIAYTLEPQVPMKNEGFTPPKYGL